MYIPHQIYTLLNIPKIKNRNNRPKTLMCFEDISYSRMETVMFMLPEKPDSIIHPSGIPFQSIMDKLASYRDVTTFHGYIFMPGKDNQRIHISSITVLEETIVFPDVEVQKEEGGYTYFW